MRDVFRNLSRGGAQHPLGHENPLKSIRGGSAPIASPPSGGYNRDLAPPLDTGSVNSMVLFFFLGGGNQNSA